MHRSRLAPPMLCLAALAAALLPEPALAPTEVEPNDDPGAVDYAGDYVYPGSPGTLAIDGVLEDGTDLDAFRFDAAATDDAVLAIVTGFTASLQMQATHVPGHVNDALSPAYPYPLRFVAGYSVLDPSHERLNLVGISTSTLDGPAGYVLRMVSPGLAATAASATCILKDAPASDSFKARLDYDPSVALGPGTEGNVEIRIRDFTALLPASGFKANGSGTKFTYKAPAPGVTKVSWNAKKGIVSIVGKKVDFESAPNHVGLPVVVLSGRGAVADPLTGIAKAGKTSTKISGKRK